MPDIAYLNGQYLPLDQATISVNDRAFFFADGVYEALRTYQRVPHGMDLHMRRLERSLSVLRIPKPACLEDFPSILRECGERAGYDETLFYIQITRGVTPRSHVFKEGLEPTVLVTAREFHPHSDACYQEGVKAITVLDERWARCDIKTVCLLANTLAKTQAHEAGAYEAILTAEDGTVREGSSSNVGIVKNGAVLTYPADRRILWGVTRAIVLDLARKDGIEVREEPYSVETLKAADEAFLMGTTYEVMPVVTVDGADIATGQPGPVARRLMALYRETTVNAERKAAE